MMLSGSKIPLALRYFSRFPQISHVSSAHFEVSETMHSRRGGGNFRGGYRGRGRRNYHGQSYSGKPDDESGQGPPRGLRGKNIGMWYARRGKQRKREMEMQNRKTVNMDAEQIGNIRNVLYNARCENQNRDEESSQGVLELNETEDFDLEGAEGKEQGNEEQEEFLPVSEMEDSWFGSLLGKGEMQEVNEKLKKDLERKKEIPQYKQMQKFREKLPSFELKNDFIDILSKNQVIVVSGETGCGKTTQVPQYILDDAIERGIGSTCKVVCTQPRRISAISVAERVSNERAEICGQNGSCGYQIRLQSKLPRKEGSILYCTTGILIQWLQSDGYLQQVSHVVLDEIHERDLHTDFLMTLIKNIIEKRKDLKIILMSATLNAELFSSYFDNCPCFHIPGFTFPVESIYLEEIMDQTNYLPSQAAFDSISRGQRGGHRKWARQHGSKGNTDGRLEEWNAYSRSELVGVYSDKVRDNLKAMHMFLEKNFDPKLVVATVKHIVNQRVPGAILIFVPGWADIKAVNDGLLNDRQFDSERFLIIPLHSMMPTTNQREVFDRPPEGVTKIVIATNIAETSITIDDVVHVVDTGKIKLSDFDPDTNMGSLDIKWISRANAKQRKGRSGRVQEGYCYHLYTKLQERYFSDFLLPEMLRTPLDQLCLQIRLLKLGKIEQFLSKVMESPSPEAVNLSIQKLTSLNALDPNQDLTPLGYHLARLPVEPQIGKMILFGAIFSCLDPVLTIAANLSFKDPFVIPLGKEKLADVRRKDLAKNSNSDHIMLLNAFTGWERARNRGYREENDFCWHYFLSKSKLKMLYDMKIQFAEHLHAIGFCPVSKCKDPSMNKLSTNMKVVLAIVCAGLYPNVGKIVPSRHDRPPKLQTKNERRVNFHPKSVNANTPFGKFNQQWICYYLKMKTNGVNLFDASEVNAFPLLFFGGDITTFFDNEMKEDMIAVDDWIVFKSKPQIANLVKDLRKEMDQILEKKIRDPSLSFQDSEANDHVISSIVNLITSE